MTSYHIHYQTNNSYELYVHEGLYQVLALPINSDLQHRNSMRLECTAKHQWWMSKNPFGFDVALVKVFGPFNDLEITLQTEVSVEHINPFDTLELDPAQSWAVMRDDAFAAGHGYFLWPTSLTAISVSDFLHLPQIGPQISPFDYLVSLCRYLHDQMTFDPDITDAHTPAVEAWGHKRGVCQDYTHIYIGICRALGIPARYVSGYLCQGLHYRGDSQLHAWAEAFVPGKGWVGIDASNNLLADHHYIKICHGRDFYDCSPFTGVLISGGKQVSLHRVSVLAHHINQ